MALFELDLVFAFGVLLEPTAADLRTLQIDEDGHVATRGLRGLAHVVVHAKMILRGAMGAVQTSHVHTGFNEFRDLLERFGGWTDGIYDLGFTHECLPIL